MDFRHDPRRVIEGAADVTHIAPIDDNRIIADPSNAGRAGPALPDLAAAQNPRHELRRSPRLRHGDDQPEGRAGMPLAVCATAGMHPPRRHCHRIAQRNDIRRAARMIRSCSPPVSLRRPKSDGRELRASKAVPIAVASSAGVRAALMPTSGLHTSVFRPLCLE